LRLERSSSRDIQIADRLMPEKFSRLVVVTGILSAAEMLLLVGFGVLQTFQPVRGAHGEWDFHLYLYAILIALTNNVDNLGAKIAYSMQGARVISAENGEW